VGWARKARLSPESRVIADSAGIGKAGAASSMAEMSVMKDIIRVPEARYAYYRRCQVFRRGGEQCKAPAEKGSLICYAHAGQLATAVRRERERRAVLEEAVAQMRRQGRPECEMADLFMDFKGINMTLAVMAQALIDGRIDCKTAGRLVVQLQTVSKLLWNLHRKGREGRKENRAPQIYADERRLGGEKASTTKDTKEHEGHKTLPRINTDDADLRKAKENLTAEARRRGEEPNAERNWAANEREETRMALVVAVLAVASRRGWAHAPPELLRAA
jgi:hypothetical protein